MPYQDLSVDRTSCMISSSQMHRTKRFRISNRQEGAY
ncbi:hypothetical protein FOZG_18255 [Fusarium oxysporum Fo47]|uniref:Uncharacterized protein n=1 Tax=Fusarium oxysporum Fo47 TaxID=660027 RepID=W9JC37_FUSOX|nr:hypothetical protein FOZG_18255 [Fusarium oxysporum Fo47]